MFATLFCKSRIKSSSIDDPVKRASTFVRMATPQPELISRLSEELDITNRLLESYLPIEKHGRQEAENWLMKTKSILLAEQRIQEIVMKVGSRWQILNPEPLSWRNTKTGMPTFGVFSVSNPDGTCTFEGSSYVRFTDEDHCTYQTVPNMKYNFPTVYTEHFNYLAGFFKTKTKVSFDAVKRGIWYRNYQKGFINLGLSAQFSGVIPPKVREEILLAERTGIKDIVVLAEVPEWKYSEEISPDPTSQFVSAPSRRGDPLVVGHDGSNLWLISVFDTTTIEQLVADEFATKPFVDSTPNWS